MDTKRKVAMRKRRHRRVRNKVSGTTERPRLTVFRSAKHIYAQVIDDAQGRTVAAVSSLKLEPVKGDKKTPRKIAVAREVGMQIAEAAKKQGVQKVTFDRSGYLYHGRVAAVAEAARKAGLEL
jgi:large subunit ribosomal protein L18